MPEAALAGSLEVVSLAGVLQLVEAEALTGTLRVDPAGSVGFAMGQAVGAECGTHSGITALLELFLDARGSFRFEPGPASGATLGSILGLIMEGCRLADEWGQIRDLRLLPTEPADADGPVAATVAAMDGQRAVADAVHHAAVARVLVVDPLRAMVEQGALYEVTSVPAPTRVQRPGTEGYARAMDDGRARLRAGDFDAAEAAFGLALTLRPDDPIASQNLRRVRQVRDGDRIGFSQWFRRR